jgi:hypothetical protein
VPASQLVPAPHAVPHPPQFEESKDVSTQPAPGQQTKDSPASRLQKDPARLPEHAASPLQIPSWQVSPGGHTIPQPPQFRLSVAKCAQAPEGQQLPAVPSAAMQYGPTVHRLSTQFVPAQIVPAAQL